MAVPDVTMAQILGHFGQSARVTRPYPDSAPIETKVMWLASAVEAQPAARLSRQTRLRIIAIDKADVPTVPDGTRIEVAEPPHGETARTWIVDGVVRPSEYDRFFAFDHHRVIVVASQDYGV